MSNESTQPIDRLGGQLLAAAREKATGTLWVKGAEGQTKQLYLQQGCLADLDTGRDETVLEAALFSTGAIADKDVKRARKSAARTNASLGAELLQLGLVAEADLAEAIRARLIAEACEVFRWDSITSGFVAHKADERLEGWKSDLADHFEVLVDPEDVIIDSARELGRWDLIQSNFSMLCDVVYATPSSFRYFRGQNEYPNEHAILSKVDGTMDVEEVIAESGVDSFAALRIVRSLHAAGDLELINPVQMFQLGIECTSASRHEKAARLFRRAHERGLDDFDIQLKLAQSLDALGRQDEAIARYMDFAEKCVGQLRVDDALKCLRRVIKLDPSNSTAQERHLDLLVQQNRTAEAVEHAMDLARRRADDGKPRAGLEVLLRVRTLCPQDVKLHHKIVEMAEASGDHAMAKAEREVLAKACDVRKDVEVALETYQKMFVGGDDSIEVRLKLVELHRAKGNRQKALDHVYSILNLPEKGRPKDDAVLRSLHETVRELKPTDIRSNRWLAEHHAKSGAKDKAAALLKSWIASLEAEGDLEEVAHAYEMLLAMDDAHEHRWGLVKVLEKLGRLPELRRELRSLANLAARKKENDEAAKALEYILRTAPLDIDTRKMQADLFEARDQRELAARKHEEIAVLSLLSGNVQDAEQYTRSLGEGYPEVAELTRKIGRLCFEQGDRQKAVEQALKAAKAHAQARNFGLARIAVNDLFAIETGHPEGTGLLAEIERRENPPPAPRAEAPVKEVKEVKELKEAPAPVPAAAAEPTPPLPSPQLAAAPAPAKAAPVPVSPALGDGGVEREPFQHAKPVKTNVAGIMARLKKLKGGNEPQRVAVAPAEIAASSEPASPAAASNGSEPSAPFSAAAEPEASPASPPAAPAASAGGTSAALKSAAARLKALAGKKAQEAGLATQPSAEPATAHEEPASGAPSAPSPPESGMLQSDGSTPVATKKLKLGGPAARLAALRKQPVP